LVLTEEKRTEGGGRIYYEAMIMGNVNHKGRNAYKKL
jgi:hypothetical protein